VGARLARQAGFAMRGGLPFEAALAAVTINPARMVGVDDRVGSLEVGKDADLVLWSGTPFEPSSQILGVLLNGELVVDPRE
jgi:imidazolonepropionase-like amidohydrolase